MAANEFVVLRQSLVDAMRGHQAHIEFDSAVSDFPPELRGKKPAGAPHSAWELLEHMRITQKDILDFSLDDGNYEALEWPEGYWPKTATPPDDQAWDASVKEFQQDALEMNKLVQDLQNKLFEPFENGDGQTLLREALLVGTHNSYHLGQLVFLKKMLAGKA
jgi:hypothetical protein